ncbi:hypothetical protein F4781DRAFT_433736 [Annulohypoxylon bovei var. microspora]|nr:hypothetical protein F4781DRAFT_433736 [Annulohypoxylon bovei var. microspora]
MAAILVAPGLRSPGDFLILIAKQEIPSAGWNEPHPVYTASTPRHLYDQSFNGQDWSTVSRVSGRSEAQRSIRPPIFIGWASRVILLPMSDAPKYPKDRSFGRPSPVPSILNCDALETCISYENRRWYISAALLEREKKKKKKEKKKKQIRVIKIIASNKSPRRNPCSSCVFVRALKNNREAPASTWTCRKVRYDEPYLCVHGVSQDFGLDSMRRLILEDLENSIRGRFFQKS